MVPYRPEPVFFVGGLEIHAFGIFLTAGVLLGGCIMIQRARRHGISGHVMFDVSLWAILFALIGAHIAKLAMDYHPLFVEHPGLILTTSAGLRSIGGLAGGLIGASIRCRLLGLRFFERIRMLDIMAYAMPFGFAVGRFGCFLAHDHRGLASTSWIAVQFPQGPRYDLGLIEFLFLMPLAGLFLILDRRPRKPGFFLGLFPALYGAFRLWMDTLHIQPMRFWEGAALCSAGIVVLLMHRKLRYAG